MVFSDKDQHEALRRSRHDRGLDFALNQLTEVSDQLHDKLGLYTLLEGSDYLLETYHESHSETARGLWVEKPVHGDRGRDISFLDSPQGWTKPGFLLQKYLEDAYLLDERKFDIRAMVRVNDDGSFRLYPDGLLRCANRPFSTGDTDPLIHNSNIAYQAAIGIKDHTDALLSQLPNYHEAMDQIERVVDDSIRALDRTGSFGGTQDFEILGFDFVMDRSGRVYLLEANQYPGMYFGRPTARRFYGGAIEHMFR